MVVIKLKHLNNIVKIPVEDRTEEQHKQIMEWFHQGSVREYILSILNQRNER